MAIFARPPNLMGAPFWKAGQSVLIFPSAPQTGPAAPGYGNPHCRQAPTCIFHAYESAGALQL